jgi:hypothetical protein
MADNVTVPIIYGLVTLLWCGQASAQQFARLECRGTLGNTPALLSGVRQHTPTNAMGDGYVRFSGTVAAGGIQGHMTYEGYTATAPFKGVIETMQGGLSIGVLDNTGGQMIIYGGRASLGPPDTIGRFVCDWQ